jgi:DNA-binding NarL/FixJ family response regulator
MPARGKERQAYLESLLFAGKRRYPGAVRLAVREGAPVIGGGAIVRILVAERDYLAGRGLGAILAELPGIEVAGLTRDADELLELVQAREPDVVVLDTRLWTQLRAEGVDLVEEIRSRRPDVGVLLLSDHLEVESLGLIRKGTAGLGYLFRKDIDDASRLSLAIREVGGGGSFLEPDVLDVLLQARRTSGLALSRGLTPRERDVLAVMASGLSNTAVARELMLTERAVQKHINSIFRKLDMQQAPDLDHRVAAVLLFLQDEEEVRPAMEPRVRLHSA